RRAPDPGPAAGHDRHVLLPPRHAHCTTSLPSPPPHASGRRAPPLVRRQRVEPALKPLAEPHQLADPEVDLLQLGAVERDRLVARAPLVERLIIQARRQRQDVVDREPDREQTADAADALDHGLVELAVAVAPPPRLDQAPALVVPERPDAHARPLGELPDPRVLSSGL